jgi:hypothetical protein
MRRTLLIKLSIAVIICAVAGGAIAYEASRPSRVSKFIACIEQRGWRRVTSPFTIKDPKRLELGADWYGGKGSYVELLAQNPATPFDLVAISEKLGVADQSRVLHEVQDSPRNFEAVLISKHPSHGEGSSTEVVSTCSDETYGNQGP